MDWDRPAGLMVRALPLQNILSRTIPMGGRGPQIQTVQRMRLVSRHHQIYFLRFNHVHHIGVAFYPYIKREFRINRADSAKQKGRIVSADSSEAPIVNTPWRLLNINDEHASSLKRRIFLAYPRSWIPCSVKSLLRPWRANNSFPTSCSRRCICWLTADWVRHTAAAAAAGVQIGNGHERSQQIEIEVNYRTICIYHNFSLTGGSYRADLVNAVHSETSNSICNVHPSQYRLVTR